MEDIFTKVKEVERISLSPGEVLVVKLEKDISNDEIQYLSDGLRDIFPDNQIAIFVGDIQFKVIEKQEAN